MIQDIEYKCLKKKVRDLKRQYEEKQKKEVKKILNKINKISKEDLK